MSAALAKRSPGRPRSGASREAGLRTASELLDEHGYAGLSIDGNPRTGGDRQTPHLTMVDDDSRCCRRSVPGRRLAAGRFPRPACYPFASRARVHRIWYHPGKQVPVRWLLVRDAAGKFEPQAFACTDQAADPIACQATR